MGRDRSMLTEGETRQVRELWEGRLRTIPADRLDPRLPATTRDFLTAVGLPTIETLGISFHHDDRLSAPLSYAGRDYLVVAESSNGASVPYLLDSESGRLYEQGFPQPGPGRFVNSDVAHFVLFLGIYRTRLDRDELTWQEAEEISVKLWLRFQASDPPAVGPPNTWWSQLLDRTDRE